MSRGKRFALGVLLVAALAVMSQASKGATTGDVDLSDKYAAAAQDMKDAEEAKAQADCHEQDVLLEGAFSYRLRRSGKDDVDRVRVIGADEPIEVDVPPASVSITEPLEGEPEYFNYDGCMRRVHIVVKKSDAATVVYE